MAKNLIKRQGLILVLVAAVLLEVTSLVQFLFVRKGLLQEAEGRAKSEMTVTRLKIENTSLTVEKDTKGMAWAYSDRDKDVAGFMDLVRVMMDNNPIIVNGFIAFREGFFPSEGKWYEPVLSRIDGQYNLHNVGAADHDYFNTDWYKVAAETGEGYWSEPYFDKDGVKSMVVTYSVPVHSSNGEFIGVFGVDVELSWLQKMIIDVQPYKNAYSTLVSREGQMLACPSETLAVSDVLRYVTPIESTGWQMSVVIPEDEIFANARKVSMFVLLLQIVGLILLILIIQRLARQQKKMEAISISREKIEEELKIARGIQMSMLPKIFPPYPDRKDIDIYASIVPAKEVGGDLYDFYLRDNKLFFCIGDVSGKGVPASLVMAVTRSLFRTVSAHENSPARIVTAMNESMSDMNESSMFVTFFCGVLDMDSGHLRYCNAGHNAPVLLNSSKNLLPVIPNIPLGIMSGMVFTEQEADLRYDDAIFLYTDGLTEAENAVHELFGEKRMLDALTGLKGSRKHMEEMQKAVATFVGDAPQSDDLTMLIIHYLNERQSLETDRHLLIHNDIQQIPQLAEFIETIAAEKKLDHSLSLSLNLALEEAVTNVIMYAYPEGTDGLVDIEAVIREKSLSFVITDSGCHFDPTAKPDADITLGAEDRPVGGLGIYLVKNIMDTVSYERKDGKNILSMTKNL